MQSGNRAYRCLAEAVILTPWIDLFTVFSHVLLTLSIQCAYIGICAGGIPGAANSVKLPIFFV